MKRWLYLMILVFSVHCLLVSCSEDRYFPGKIYEDKEEDNTIVDEGNTIKNENIAVGGAVISSSQQDESHDATLLINGLIQGGEEYFGTFQTQSDHEEWVQIKLVQQQRINSIWLYPRATNEGFPADFKLEVSLNAKDWKTVIEKTDYKAENDNPQKFDFTEENAAYVRLVATKLATANNMWTDFKTVYYFQLREIEVYFKEDSELPTTDPDEPNLALGGFAQSSSEEPGKGPAVLVDGNYTETIDKYFGTLSSTEENQEWVSVKLSREDHINEILLYPKYGGAAVDGFPVDFELMVSTNGTDWTTVVRKTAYPVPSYTPDDPTPEKFVFDTVRAGYVKIVGTKLYAVSNEWTNWQKVYVMQFAELEVYNNKI